MIVITTEDDEILCYVFTLAQWHRFRLEWAIDPQFAEPFQVRPIFYHPGKGGVFR